MTHEFLTGGGEMGERIRNYKWEETALGPIDAWPRSLRTCIQIMLTSRQPIWIGWGADLIKLYNDPYRQIVQGKHPWALGKPASVVWKDIWKDIDPMLRKVMLENEGTYVEEQLLIMQRNGYPEETYYTFSYTPVAGDDGRTAGMICFNTDDTDRIISERQLKTLTELGKVLNDLKTVDEACHQTMMVLKGNPHDFPFALLYTSAGDHPELVSATEKGTVFERRYNVRAGDDLRELMELFRRSAGSGKPEILEDLRRKVGEMPGGAWDVSPDRAIILPVAHRGHKDPYAYLVIGVNPFRPLDEKYAGFFQLVADQVATSLANIHAIEEERKRLEALAEIDRAKTVFFSNISHEFRTPLTLMLGSVEELMTKESETIRAHRSTVETTHRNALRLLRLVNNLLDFSRIEAGREKANFRKVDISALTRELASNFSSLVETAGLSYELDVKNVDHDVYVDREMWEKIVLNLVSNAFKYTLKGGIRVMLAAQDGRVILRVRDTGVGIPENELPKMFQRFHRIQNSTGRTHEGTGIGLSLVSELVRLHHGRISVTSKQGEGSEFKVEIPIGKEHIAEEQITVSGAQATSSLSDTFIEETASLIEHPSRETEDPAPGPVHHGARIMVVDDNPDMRTYIRHLLEKHFRITTAKNGRDALEKMKAGMPELVLSDIMMPVMDGVELMKEIKRSPATQGLPVILLSARAGEESRIEGFDVGADDYLIKPFSARELIARINAQVRLSRIRKQVENNLRNVILQAPVATALLRGPSFVVEIANAHALEIWGKSAEQVMNKPVAQAMPEIVEQGFMEILNDVYTTGNVFRANEMPVTLVRFGKSQTLYINFIYSPLRDEDDRIIGLIGLGVDVTEQVESRRLIEETRAALNNAVELADLGTWEIDLTTSFTTFSPRVADWWGLPEEGAPLETVIGCMHADDRGHVAAAVQEAIDRTGYYEAEYRLMNAKTGQERHIQANGNVSYDEQHHPVRLAGIVRDITLHRLAQKELERQVKVRTTELEQLNEDLRRSNNELMQFAYVASHDLQEPLRKIQTFSDLARSSGSNGNVVSFLDKIDRSAARMSALIKDVLLYSKVSNEGKGITRIDLNEILDDVRNDFELLITQKNARISSDVLPEVAGTRLQFHQLFSNLVSNSLKFSDTAPHVQISHRVVAGNTMSEMKADASRNYHQLTFQDNGIGFDQAYADQIFGLFTRLHNKKDYTGTGIGLALCKKIVENQNGFISAQSGEDAGARFTIYLPAESFGNPRVAGP